MQRGQRWDPVWGTGNGAGGDAGDAGDAGSGVVTGEVADVVAWG